LALLAFALILFMPSSSIAVGLSTLDTIKARGVLLWGSDSGGGAPYVFPDPKDPSKLIGFELDIMEAIAKQLGVIGPSGAEKAHSSGVSTGSRPLRRARSTWMISHSNPSTEQGRRKRMPRPFGR